jgi:two-component system chemotaxis sensor kinase CheA
MVGALRSRELESDVPRLKRTLHTLKGTAAMMGLQLVAEQSHLLEEELSVEGRASDAQLEELGRRWQRIHQQLGSLTPPGERAIEVPVPEFSALLSRLSKEQLAPELLEQLESWRLEPAAAPLERLAEQARSLALRLGKQELQVSVRAERVRLDPLKWRGLFTELVHVVRNAVDHGIELPDARRAAGKPAGGRLVLGAQLAGGVLTFEVSDDGSGINWDILREKGRARGLPCSTEQELLEVLCTDGISSRAMAGEISGRGVGMAAVKQAVEQLKGRIEVRSSARGTTWLFTFPSRARTGLSQYPEASLASRSQAARSMRS